jgi:hypothetical protein
MKYHLNMGVHPSRSDDVQSAGDIGYSAFSNVGTCAFLMLSKIITATIYYQ